MNLDETIRIITYPIDPDKVWKSCQFIVEEIKKIAEPIAVEKAESMNAWHFGIVYNREKQAIRVDPVVFAYNLEDAHKNTNIAYEKLLLYFVDHEKGHFELQQQGLQPTLRKNRIYMTLYSRFEDYAISRFLRSGDYLATEKAVLKTESKRRAKTFNDICVYALYTALGYVKLKELPIFSKAQKYVRLISLNMKVIKKPMDIPETVDQLSLKLAHKDWKNVF